MKKPLISILICTVTGRVSTFLPKIIEELNKQATKEVEIIYVGDNRQRSVGKKRNDLLSMAQGEYVAFVDDDDFVSKDYISELLTGTSTGADVVCFKVLYKEPNKKGKEVIYNGNFVRDKNKYNTFERLPNHIMLIRKELALEVGFKEISFGEDKDFAMRLKPYITSQYIIDKVLYFYYFSHKTSETQ